jgi:hypothetical protein
VSLPAIILPDNQLYQSNGLVIGSILGDGYLNPRGNITIEHCFAQREYVEWKHKMFRNLGALAKTSKISTVVRNDSRTQKQTKSCRFFTSGIYKRERALFYPSGKKVIPAQLPQIIDPLALAIWFMDDGGRGSNTAIIDVTAFTNDERIFLRDDVFKGVYNLKTSLHKHGGKAMKIYIRRESGDAFYDIVKPYMAPSMLTKLSAYTRNSL